MKECQELIDKVSEFRHSRVKQRQIDKFNRLIEKEGNITWSGSQGTQASTSPWAARVRSSQAVSTLPLQLGLVLPRQVAALPGWLALLLRQSGLVPC